MKLTAVLHLLKKFFVRRKLRSDILFSSLTILSISITLIISYTYYTNTSMIHEQAYEHIKNSTENLNQGMSEALKEAEKITKFYSLLLASNDLYTVPSNISLIDSFSSIFSSYSHITTVYFGTPQGLFIEIVSPLRVNSYIETLGLKFPENTTTVFDIINHDTNFDPFTLKKKTIDHLLAFKVDENSTINPDKIGDSHQVWYYLIDSKNLSVPQIGEKTGYDNRNRDWFKASSVNRNIVWSNIYVFGATLRGETGITVSKAIIDLNDNFKGVFAADITLKTFSEVLLKNKISENAYTFVLDENNNIIINSLGKSNTIVKGLEYELTKPDTFGSPLLSETLKVHRNSPLKKDFIYFNFENKDYFAHFSHFPQIFQNNWQTITICPVDDFVGRLQESKNYVFIFSLIILIISFFLSFRIALRISNPIIAIAEEANKIKDLDLSGKIKVGSPIKEINDLEVAINSLKTSIQSFSYYIPKTLVRKLLNKKQAIQIGGKGKEVTLMFTDIANFTTVSEKLNAEKLTTFLSEYFEEMSKIIMDNNGTVDKYIGDAIMAFWGAPLNDSHHPTHACQAALLCQIKLAEIHRFWKRDQRPLFNTRIGIHTGEAIIGNIGSSERMNYTAIGDNVNLCSRLEGLNKYYGTNIIISETVQEKVKHCFLTRILDSVAVKGKTKPIHIYELVGRLKGEDLLYPTEEQIEFCKIFNHAYELFLGRQWQEVIDLLENEAKPLKPLDITIEMYIKRCQDYLLSPPPAEWDHTVVMDHK